MSDRPPTTISELLGEVRGGRTRAAEELLELMYVELRSLAHGLMAKVPPGNTLQPTELLHEAYHRMVKSKDPGWDSRGHFFGSAARAMRRILVEQARRKAAAKHGGGQKRVDPDDVQIRIEAPHTDIPALNEALEQLERIDPRAAKVVDLRYFVGLSVQETADVMGLSVSTVEREWRFARTALHARLESPRR